MPNKRNKYKTKKVQMIYLPVIITTLYSLNNGVIKKSFVQHIPIFTKCQKIVEPFLIIKCSRAEVIADSAV